MSSRMTLAKQLIQSGEFDIAKSMLSKEQNDPQALYLLSLLHRYDDEYDQELGVIKQSLDIDGGNAYMRDRLAWHNLPLFDRVVPRKPLNLPRDPYKIPSQEVLDQMCFVTGADSKYFQLMVECIESIKATNLYKHIPIYVLDCGLTKDEKKYLLETLDIAGINDLSKMFPNIHNGFLKNIRVRPILHKIFPGKRYYFFMDADAWLYDENCVDHFLTHAQKYGIGVTQDLCGPAHGKFYGFNGCSPNILANALFEENILKIAPAINAGVYCLDTQSSVQKKWEENLELCIAEKGHKNFTDQAALSVALGQLNITAVFSPAYNYFYPIRPAFLINGLFYTYDQKELIGIIHAAGGANQNIKYTYYQTYAIKDDGSHVKVSYRYRVWPWQDKNQINEMISREVE